MNMDMTLPMDMTYGLHPHAREVRIFLLEY